MGTAGADNASATTGTISGFTGGTLAELTDLVGDYFLGSGSADTVVAGNGADSLDGGAGDDILNGGGDLDGLYGNEGYDVFQVGGTGVGYDYIWDFAGGAGAIDVPHFQSGGFASTAALRPASVFASGNTTIASANGSVTVLVGVDTSTVLDEDLMPGGFF